MTKQGNISVIHALCALLPVALPVHGAQWTAAAGIAPAITYTDNICLSADDEQGEWIALVTPDVTISGTGRRANLDITASLEMNSLSDSKLEDLGCNPLSLGNRSQFAPRLRASADAILVEGWFYIDALASADQTGVSPFVAGGGDSLNRTGNTNTATNYSVSPFVSHRFKDAADLMLRYTWDEQFNSSDLVRDSSDELVAFTLGNNPASSAITWGLQANYSNVKYSARDFDLQDAQDSELTSAQLNLGYQFNRNWQVNGFYGEESNDFTSFSDQIDGDFWDVGIRWTPNSRTVVELGTGDRFFGDTPRFSVSHKYQRSLFEASYSRDLTYDRNIRTLEDGSSLSNGPVQQIDPNTGLPAGTAGNQTTLSTSPILDERFTLGYSYEWRRSTLNLNASHSEQTRAEDGRNSKFTYFSAALNRRLARNLTVNGRLSWDDQAPLGARSDFIGDSDTWRFQLGVTRVINTNTDVSLDYNYSDRTSDRVNDEYTENRITLTIRFKV